MCGCMVSLPFHSISAPRQFLSQHSRLLSLVHQIASRISSFDDQLRTSPCTKGKVRAKLRKHDNEDEAYGGGSY